MNSCRDRVAMDSQSWSSIWALFSLIIVSSILRSAAVAVAAKRAPIGGDNSTAAFIKTWCNATLYPEVCVASISSYAVSVQSELVKAAVKVSLGESRNVSAWATALAARKGLGKKERAALSDCIENFEDTFDQIKDSLKELKHLRPHTFKFQMSNVQTWMSAALTNEDSCLDGFQGVNGRVQRLVKRRVQNVSKLISNALAFANRLASIVQD